uniref:Putative secreted protein n=1 Tax=Panstrongylus lignarius TaxID=156445 RepID=A0A224Y6D4_9HEMI
MMHNLFVYFCLVPFTSPFYVTLVVWMYVIIMYNGFKESPIKSKPLHYLRDFFCVFLYDLYRYLYQRVV